MSRVRVALAGIGNCASALVQGKEYYKEEKEENIGLLAYDIGGITPTDIDFVAAFDVNDNKVGKDLSEAIAQEPNNTPNIVSNVPQQGVKVTRGPVLDGIGSYMVDVIKSSNPEGEDVAQVLKDSGAEILVNYIPVGSTQATKYYAEQAMKAGVAFVNAIPVFIASNPEWEARFKEKGLPVAGDDVMSQIGATVVHKSLIKLFVDRGVKVDETYQLNVGGDADFLNMLEESRLKDKRESKTSAVKAMTPYDVPTKIGPSDYIPFLKNDKICYVMIKGRYFGNTPVQIDLKLHVVDATNSGGVMIDAIRATKIALDRKISGALTSISAYCFKHPPIQMPYEVAKAEMMAFIEGKNDR